MGEWQGGKSKSHNGQFTSKPLLVCDACFVKCPTPPHWDSSKGEHGSSFVIPSLFKNVATIHIYIIHRENGIVLTLFLVQHFIFFHPKNWLIVQVWSQGKTSHSTINIMQLLWFAGGRKCTISMRSGGNHNFLGVQNKFGEKAPAAAVH